MLTLLLAACGPGEDSRLTRTAVQASACSGCHSGAAGTITDLGSMQEEALAASFLAYRNDEMGSSVMHRIARGYSEQDIRAIAEYLARED